MQLRGKINYFSHVHSLHGSSLYFTLHLPPIFTRAALCTLGAHPFQSPRTPCLLTIFEKACEVLSTLGKRKLTLNIGKKLKQEIILKMIQSTTSYFGNPYYNLVQYKRTRSFPKQNLDSQVARVCPVNERTIVDNYHDVQNHT